MVDKISIQENIEAVVELLLSAVFWSTVSKTATNVSEIEKMYQIGGKGGSLQSRGVLGKQL